MPQGSILGPLLFLVFINDIEEEINSYIWLYADETSLYIVVDDPLDSAIKLNADFSRIDIWACHAPSEIHLRQKIITDFLFLVH